MRLLVLFGPPAVGKMTVGRAIAERSDFRLFHNHATIEPLLEVFDYGTPPFNRLLGVWRRGVLSEAATSGVDLVLTLVWALEHEHDLSEVGALTQPYVDAGADIAFVELVAGLDTRLARNSTEHRLAEKRSKRDLQWSADNVREMEQHVMVTTPGERTAAQALLDTHRHLRLDNTELSPARVAEVVLDWLG